jgi:hypothetical protein
MSGATAIPEPSGCADDCTHPSHRHGEPAAEVNPKDRVARGKVPLSLVPPAGIIYCAMALRSGAYESPRADGGVGYGPYNWRDTPIRYMAYLDAMERHRLRLIDREDCDPVSMVHALGHIMATCAILADAIEGGWLIDDRPKKGPAPAVLDQMRAFIAERSSATSENSSRANMANVCAPRRPELDALVAAAIAAFNKMSPEEREAQMKEQRESWARSCVQDDCQGERSARLVPRYDPPEAAG